MGPRLDSRETAPVERSMRRAALLALVAVLALVALSRVLEREPSEPARGDPSHEARTGPAGGPRRATPIAEREPLGPSGRAEVGASRIAILDARDRRPVVGAAVRALAADRGEELTSDGDGWVPLVGDEGALLVRAQGYVGAFAAFPVGGAPAELLLQPEGHVVVELTDLDGRPAPGLRVGVLHPHGDEGDGVVDVRARLDHAARLERFDDRVVDLASLATYPEEWARAAARRPRLLEVQLTDANGAARFSVPRGPGYRWSVVEPTGWSLEPGAAERVVAESDLGPLGVEARNLSSPFPVGTDPTELRATRRPLASLRGALATPRHEFASVSLERELPGDPGSEVAARRVSERHIRPAREFDSFEFVELEPGSKTLTVVHESRPNEFSFAVLSLELGPAERRDVGLLAPATTSVVTGRVELEFSAQVADEPPDLDPDARALLWISSAGGDRSDVWLSEAVPVLLERDVVLHGLPPGPHVLHLLLPDGLVPPGWVVERGWSSVQQLDPRTHPRFGIRVPVTRPGRVALEFPVPDGWRLETSLVQLRPLTAAGSVDQARIRLVQGRGVAELDVPAAPYELTAFAVLAREGDRTSWVCRERVVASPLEERDVLRPAVLPGRHVDFDVRDAGGAPAVGAEIELGLSVGDGSSVSWIQRAVTGPDGAARLHGLDPRLAYVWRCRGRSGPVDLSAAVTSVSLGDP